MATGSTHWCKQHLLITVDGPQGRFVKAIDKPFARVGSHPRSEIVLADDSIAQRSVYFHATDEGVFCVDLSATDSEGSSRRGWMESRGNITVGAYRISAQLAHSSGAPPTTRRTNFQGERSAAVPYPVVAISAGGQEIARHPLSRRLTLVGRRRPSTLRLTTHSVSTTHCIAYSDAHALWIVDLLSSNGTRFHGEAVDVVALPIGESVTLGRVELTRLDPSEEKGKPRQEEEAKDGREEEEEAREGEAREETAHGGPASQQPSATSSRPSVREIEELTAALDRQRAAFLVEQCEARRQRKQWEKEAVETEARHLQQTQRIEQYFAELGVEQDELRRKEERWRSEQDQAQEALAGERQQLAALLAELAKQREQLESDRRAAQQQQDALGEKHGRWEADHQSAKTRLEQRRNELTAAAAELDSQRRLLESERQQFQQRHEQWLAERGTHEAADQSHREEIAQAEADQQRRTEAMRRQLAELEARESEFDEQQRRWETQRQEAEAEQARQQTDLADLQAELHAQRQPLESQHTAMEEQREAIKEQRAALEEQRRQWAAERDVLDRERRREVERAEAEQARQTETIRRQLAELETSKSEFDEQQRRWETQRKEAEAEQARQQTDLADLQAELHAQRQPLESQHTAIKEQREALEEQRQQWAAERDALERERRRELEAAQAEQARQTEAVRLQQAKLVSDADEFNEQRKSWETQRKETEGEFAQTSRQLAELQAELATKQEQLDSREEAVEEQHRQRIAQWEELDRSHRQTTDEAAAERERQTDDIQRQLAAVQARQNQLESQRARWEKDQEGVEADLVGRQRELDNAVAELDARHLGIESQQQEFQQDRKRRIAELEARQRELEQLQTRLLAEQEDARKKRREWESQLEERQDEFQQEQDRWQDASEQEKTDLLNRAQNLEREAARLETRGQAFEQDRSDWESQRRQTETALAVHQQELVGQRAELNQARQQLESGQPRHGLQRSPTMAPASAGAPVRRRQPKRVSRPAPAEVMPSRPVMADYRIVAVAAGLLCAVGAGLATWFALGSEHTAVDHASTNHAVDVRPNPHARQLEAVDRDVAQYGRQLESRRNEHALLVPETLVVRHQLALQQIKKTSTELGQVQSRHKLAEKERDERKIDLETDLQASFSDAELDAQLQRDSVAVPLLIKLDDLEKRKSEIEATAAPAVLARYLESCQRDLDATTARLNERRDALRAELQAQAQESIRVELQQSQEEIDGLEEEERQLQDKLQEPELEVKDIEGRVARAAAMQEDIRHLETQLNDSLAERERLDVPIRDSSVSSTEPPTIEDRGSFSSRHLLTTLAVVVAFLIPLLGVTWWTARTGREP